MPDKTAQRLYPLKANATRAVRNVKHIHFTKLIPENLFTKYSIIVIMKHEDTIHKNNGYKFCADV